MVAGTSRTFAAVLPVHILRIEYPTMMPIGIVDMTQSVKSVSIIATSVCSQVSNYSSAEKERGCRASRR